MIMWYFKNEVLSTMSIYKIPAFIALMAITVIAPNSFAQESSSENANPNDVITESTAPSEVAPKVMAPTPELPADPVDPIQAPSSAEVLDVIPEVQDSQIEDSVSKHDSQEVAPVQQEGTNQKTVESGKVMLQSVMIVNLPSADASIVDDIVNAHHEKDFEKFSQMFSEDGFVVITPDYNVINSIEGLEAKWDKVVVNGVSFKDAKINATVDSVKDLAPGIGIFVGRMNVDLGAGSTAESKFTMIARYIGDEWKIIQMHVSSKDIMKMIIESERVEPMLDLMAMVYGLFGVLIGFVLAKVMTRKNTK